MQKIMPVMLQDSLLINDWHPVARATDLDTQNPIGTRLLGEDIVLWRAGDAILAWQDLCVHRGTRLSIGKVEGECLACPYHGWTYNTTGHCVHIPAHPSDGIGHRHQPPPTKARVRTYQTKVAYGLIWVTLGQPTHDIPRFEEGHNNDFRQIICGPYAINAAAPRIAHASMTTFNPSRFCADSNAACESTNLNRDDTNARTFTMPRCTNAMARG